MDRAESRADEACRHVGDRGFRERAGYRRTRTRSLVSYRPLATRIGGPKKRRGAASGLLALESLLSAPDKALQQYRLAIVVQA